MKRSVILLMVVVLLGSGCGLTPGERIDKVEQAITYYEQQAGVVDATILDLETYLSGASIELQKAQQAGDDELMAKAQEVIDSITLKLQKARQQKKQLDDAVATGRQRIADIRAGVDEVGLGDELKFYGETMTGTAPLIPPPWGAVLGVVGLIIGGVGQGIKVRQGTGIKQIVAGVEKVKSAAAQDPVTLDRIMDLLESTQTKTAKKLVDQAQDKIKAETPVKPAA